MKRKSILVVILLLAFLGVANATPFQNGGFEIGYDPASSFLTFYNPIGTPIPLLYPQDVWMLEAGTVNLVTSIDYIGGYWNAAEGSRSIDLNGSPGFGYSLQPGIISQTFDTEKDGVYQVLFDMAGNPDGGDTVKSIGVTAAGSSALFDFNTTGKTKTDMGWTGMSFFFTATSSSTKLTFASLEDGYYGPALDNVRVNAVPEPATMLLLGLGLVGIALVGRRKFLK